MLCFAGKRPTKLHETRTKSHKTDHNCAMPYVDASLKTVIILCPIDEHRTTAREIIDDLQEASQPISDLLLPFFHHALTDGIDAGRDHGLVFVFPEQPRFRANASAQQYFWSVESA